MSDVGVLGIYKDMLAFLEEIPIISTNKSSIEQ
jgi:hypothetical protein